MGFFPCLILCVGLLDEPKAGGPDPLSVPTAAAGVATAGSFGTLPFMPSPGTPSQASTPKADANPAPPGVLPQIDSGDPTRNAVGKTEAGEVILEYGPEWNTGGACPYPPGRFWGSAEFLLWWTRGSPLPPLLTTSPAGTPQAAAGVLGQPGTSVLFGGNDVDEGVRSGGRFTAGAWIFADHTLGIEGNFFFLENLATNYSISSTGIPILARPFVNFTPGAAFGMNSSLKVAYPGLVAGSFAASTKSNLLGSDVYFRVPICCGCCSRLDFLAGYRYLRLSEGLGITDIETSTNPASPLFGIPFVINEGFNTSNNFSGGELGFIGECMRNGWFVRVIGKVALGATDRNVNINGMTTIDGAAPVPGGFLALPSNIGSYHSSTFSVVPEIGINLGYAITPNLRVFTGYTFLYWTQVARPGDQIDLAVNTTQPPLGNGLVGPARPAFSLHQSDFWAQGINFGVELRY